MHWKWTLFPFLIAYRSNSNWVQGNWNKPDVTKQIEGMTIRTIRNQIFQLVQALFNKDARNEYGSISTQKKCWDYTSSREFLILSKNAKKASLHCPILPLGKTRTYYMLLIWGWGGRHYSRHNYYAKGCDTWTEQSLGMN